MKTTTISLRSRWPKAAWQLLVAPAGLVVPVFFGLRWLGHPASVIDALAIIFPWLALPVAGGFGLALATRARRLALLPALAAGMLLGIYGPYYLPRTKASASGPVFTAMTHNVLYSAREAQPFLEQVAAQSPDIIAFQEFLPPKSKVITAALSKSHPFQAVAGTFGLFSRFPITDCELVYSADRESDIAQRCGMVVQGRPLTVFNVHLRTPSVRLTHLPALKLPVILSLGPSRRDGDLDVLIAQTDRTAGQQLVLGDFNLTDQSPAYQQMRLRWNDAFRSAGWGLGFSFRTARLSLPLWRIDYILHSHNLAALETYMGTFGASDHRPVIARLGFIR